MTYRNSKKMTTFTLCVRSVDMQKPLCAFHTLTVVSLDADITKQLTHHCIYNQNNVIANNNYSISIL